MSSHLTPWAFAALVAMTLASGGCDEPDAIVTQPPPGGNIRDSLRPKEEAAEALGEIGNTPPPVKPAVLPGLVPAPPTAKGETKTTPSGVKYETLKEGTGEPVEAGAKVSVHYVGTLDDGRKFDSSRDRNAPHTYYAGTGAVIRGWDEVVPGMRVGEVRKIWVPAAAAYGALGKGDIPPNAPLNFEIELVKVEK